MTAPPSVLAKSRNIKGFIAALKGIKASSKQARARRTGHG